MADLKIVYPFYNNHSFMESLRPRLCAMPCDIVIVDDASAMPLRVECANVRVMRIDVDVPWNQPAASNLGIKSLRPEDVVLRLDIDHWVDPGEFGSFLKAAGGLPAKSILQFGRRLAGGGALEPNMNMLMMRVSDFVGIGCYDEDFCGNYGHDDSEFLERARRKGYSVSVHREATLLVESGGGTRGLSRDTSVNKEKLLRKRREIAEGMVSIRAVERSDA